MQYQQQQPQPPHQQQYYQTHPTPRTVARTNGHGYVSPRHQRVASTDEEHEWVDAFKPGYCYTISGCFWCILVLTILVIGAGIGVFAHGLIQQQNCKQDFTKPNGGHDEYQTCRDHAFIEIVAGCVAGGVFIILCFMSCCAFMDCLCFRACKVQPPHQELRPVSRRNSVELPQQQVIYSQPAPVQQQMHQQTTTTTTQQHIVPQHQPATTIAPASAPIVAQQQHQNIATYSQAPLSHTNGTTTAPVTTSPAVHFHPVSAQPASTSTTSHTPPLTTFHSNHPPAKSVLHTPPDAPRTLSEIMKSSNGTNSNRTSPVVPPRLLVR